MILQTFLRHFTAVQNVPGHPFAFHKPLERLLLVLRATVIDDNVAQLVDAGRLDRTMFGVHFVSGEAKIGIEDERRGQIVVLRQFLGRHADVLGLGGGTVAAGVGVGVAMAGR